MKEFLLGFIVGAVLWALVGQAAPPGSTSQTVPAGTKIASVKADGTVTFAKGWTCEDAVRVLYGFRLDQTGRWYHPVPQPLTTPPSQLVQPTTP